MSNSSDVPNWAQLFREVQDATIGRLAILMPSEVISYDSSQQTAVLRPFQRGRVRVPDTGDLEPLEFPEVHGVPILWNSWAGGTASVTGTLQPGDYVLMVICDRSIDEWKAANAAPYTPEDIRRCDLTDAMGFPGGRPPASPLPASALPATGDPSNTLVVQGSVKLGSSAANDRVVTESRLQAALQEQKLRFDAHTHTGAAVGAPTSTPALAATATVWPTPTDGSLSSPDVKAT